MEYSCLSWNQRGDSGPIRYTWMLMGKLARIVYGCKLHQVDKDDGAAHPYFPNTNLEELRYVWWTVIKIDNFSNVLAGTPRAIDAMIAATSLPCTSVSDFTAGMEPDPSLKYIHGYERMLSRPSWRTLIMLLLRMGSSCNFPCVCFCSR